MPDIVMFHGHHDYEFIAHSHDVATLIVVTKGAVQIEIDELRHDVTAGDLVLIGAHQIHSARPLSTSGWEMRSLHAPSSLLTRGLVCDPASNLHAGRPVLPPSESAATLFLDMHHQAGTRAELNRQLDQINTFLEWLQANCNAFQPRVVSPEDPNADFGRAEELIARAAFDSTQMESIAAELGVSIYSLIRRFKKKYRIPPHAWRMQLRANEAARLLGDGVRLANVAASCGFADQAHMSRVFKRVYGVTPREYSLLHEHPRSCR